MSELVEIVDSLENKISKLLHKLELLSLANKRLEEELDSVKDDRDLAKNSTEAKLKINTLIRELDHCITQLAE